MKNLDIDLFSPFAVLEANLLFLIHCSTSLELELESPAQAIMGKILTKLFIEVFGAQMKNQKCLLNVRYKFFLLVICLQPFQLHNYIHINSFFGCQLSDTQQCIFQHEQTSHYLSSDCYSNEHFLLLPLRHYTYTSN